MTYTATLLIFVPFQKMRQNRFALSLYVLSVLHQNIQIIKLLSMFQTSANQFRFLSLCAHSVLNLTRTLLNTVYWIWKNTNPILTFLFHPYTTQPRYSHKTPLLSLLPHLQKAKLSHTHLKF